MLLLSGVLAWFGLARAIESPGPRFPHQRWLSSNQEGFKGRQWSHVSNCSRFDSIPAFSDPFSLFFLLVPPVWPGSSPYPIPMIPRALERSPCPSACFQNGLFCSGQLRFFLSSKIVADQGLYIRGVIVRLWTLTKATVVGQSFFFLSRRLLEALSCVLASNENDRVNGIGHRPQQLFLRPADFWTSSAPFSHSALGGLAPSFFCLFFLPRRATTSVTITCGRHDPGDAIVVDRMSIPAIFNYFSIITPKRVAKDEKPLTSALALLLHSHNACVACTFCLFRR